MYEDFCSPALPARRHSTRTALVSLERVSPQWIAAAIYRRCICLMAQGFVTAAHLRRPTGYEYLRVRQMLDGHTWLHITTGPL
jgi:hypothetical protein